MARIQAKVIAAVMLGVLSLGGVIAQEKPISSTEVTGQGGVNRAKSIMDAVRNGDYSQLPAGTRDSIQTGLESGAKASDTSRMDAKTVDFAVQQSTEWERMAREAYVAALPPRDRALGASVMLGDGALPGGSGSVYIFVSRSMPQALLRAYALDAFYLGAELVVKGIRRGDTLKEYIAESMEHYNSVDGIGMAGISINPNLFDMFDVKLVPAVVWTNRAGLNDVGSGCQNPPEGSPVEKLTIDGPDDSMIEVDKPACAKVPESTYYKMSGALTMPYVIDRFQDAGLPKATADALRAKLAERTGNIHDGTVQQTIGNAMPPVSPSAKIDRMPKHVLKELKEQLTSGFVQRGPFGPTFSPDGEDDAAYRQELNEKIRHGLGL